MFTLRFKNREYNHLKQYKARNFLLYQNIFIQIIYYSSDLIVTIQYSLKINPVRIKSLLKILFSSYRGAHVCRETCA